MASQPWKGGGDGLPGLSMLHLKINGRGRYMQHTPGVYGVSIDTYTHTYVHTNIHIYRHTYIYIHTDIHTNSHI